VKECKAKDIIKALTKKGFREDTSGHHKFYHLIYCDKEVGIYTKISHGARDISASILSQIAKQLKISNNELEDLVRCPLSSEGYIEILRQKNEL